MRTKVILAWLLLFGLPALVVFSWTRATSTTPDPKLLAAALSRLDSLVDTCGGVESDSAISCVCAGVPRGVTCHGAPGAVGFRGSALPVVQQDMLLLSPHGKPSGTSLGSDPAAQAFVLDAFNDHVIPLGRGWYRVGNCAGCD